MLVVWAQNSSCGLAQGLSDAVVIRHASIGHARWPSTGTGIASAAPVILVSATTTEV